MNQPPNNTEIETTQAAAELRQWAEEKIAGSPQNREALSPEATQQMLHELRVHQIELEMQNEELRRAQVELDSLRARYFDLYELAPVGYCSVNEHGLILEANLAAVTLLGVARSALVTQPISRFIFKEDQDSYYLLRKRIITIGEPQSCELRMVKHDGTPFWAHLTATAAQDKDGAPSIRVVLKDITERKQIESQLLHAKENAEHISAELLAYIKAGGKLALVSVTDRSGRILQANAKFCEVSGYSEAELIGQDHRILNSGTHPKEFFAGMWATIARGDVWHREICNRSKNGQLYWVDSTIVPLKDEDGQITRYLSVRVDITERKAAEAEIHALNQNLDRLVTERTGELRESSERLLLATRAGGVGIWDWDIVRDMLTWDEQMFALYGVTQDCFGGAYEAWKAGVHPKDVQRANAEIQMALRGEKNFDTEFRILWPNGTIRNIRALGNIRRDASGQPLRMIGTNWDITVHKQAEARALTEQALRARDAAMRELMVHVERLREEDRKYIAREIHDELGQVLAALRLEASMLQGKGNTQDSNVDIIRHNILALVDEAIKGMRTVAADLRPASLELGVVAAIEKLSNDFVKHTSVSCILHPLAAGPIDLDQEQTTAIFRIVQESLTNVVRHAAASRVEITLTQSAGDFIVEVRDNGKGFDPALTGKRKSFGLLGMRERAAALGGSIDIASVPQQGTVVSARIPIERNEWVL